MLDKFENGDKIMIAKPQRRAILHLKSQKRKIKDKNKDKVMMMFFYLFISTKNLKYIIKQTVPINDIY